MDLSKLDQGELLELRMQVNKELENYDNREKTKAYGIYAYDEWNRYLKKENAIEYLKSIINDGDVLYIDDYEIKIAVQYIDRSQFEYCKDWWKVKGDPEYRVSD